MAIWQEWIRIYIHLIFLMFPQWSNENQFYIQNIIFLYENWRRKACRFSQYLIFLIGLLDKLKGNPRNVSIYSWYINRNIKYLEMGGTLSVRKWLQTLYLGQNQILIWTTISSIIIGLLAKRSAHNEYTWTVKSLQILCSYCDLMFN